jgi:hypothetical protein
MDILTNNDYSIFSEIAKFWMLIIGSFITVYLFIPRVYIWLSYDETKKNTYLKIKNTSKIGTTIKIKNIESFKNIIEAITKGHSNHYNDWDEHFVRFGNKLNIPPDSEISLPLGFVYCDLSNVNNEFKIKFKQGLLPFMYRKIYLNNLKRYTKR